MLNHLGFASFLRFSATSAASVFLLQKAQKDAEFLYTNHFDFASFLRFSATSAAEFFAAESAEKRRTCQYDLPRDLAKINADLDVLSAEIMEMLQEVHPSSTLASKYLLYVFHAMELEFARLKMGSTHKTIYMPDVLQFSTPVPPLEEQTQIAKFLDYETAKIDALIEKQQQLIALLKEKRQAVISHAVTKGLNPDAPMRDSGVEWLGEVPAHWEVARAKYLLEFVTSGSRGWAEFYSDDGALFFRIANLTRDTIEPKLLSIQNVTPPHGSEGERSRIKEGDLLISITADLGSVCVADNTIAGGYVSQHVSLCRPNRRVESSRWLGYLVLSDVVKEQLLGSGYGGTKIQLSLDDIRELVLASPYPAEQRQIANHLDARMADFSKLITASEAK